MHAIKYTVCSFIRETCKCSLSLLLVAGVMVAVCIYNTNWFIRFDGQTVSSLTTEFPSTNSFYLLFLFRGVFFLCYTRLSVSIALICYLIFFNGRSGQFVFGIELHECTNTKHIKRQWKGTAATYFRFVQNLFRFTGLHSGVGCIMKFGQFIIQTAPEIRLFCATIHVIVIITSISTKMCIKFQSIIHFVIMIITNNLISLTILFQNPDIVLVHEKIY